MVSVLPCGAYWFWNKPFLHQKLAPKNSGAEAVFGQDFGCFIQTALFIQTTKEIREIFLTCSAHVILRADFDSQCEVTAAAGLIYEKKD